MTHRLLSLLEPQDLDRRARLAGWLAGCLIGAAVGAVALLLLTAGPLT